METRIYGIPKPCSGPLDNCRTFDYHARMSKTKYLSVRIDEDEERRIAKLSGQSSIAAFVMDRIFSMEQMHGNKEEYPGWEVVERGRRDRGIRISHPTFGETVMLYPEDREYRRLYHL